MAKKTATAPMMLANFISAIQLYTETVYNALVPAFENLQYERNPYPGGDSR
jgi:hypothetical protein